MNDQQNASQSAEQPTVAVPAELQAGSLVPIGAKPQQTATSTESRSRKSMAAKREQAEAVQTFAGDLHEYIREYILFADQKAAFVFAGAGAMLGYLETKGVTKLWVKTPLAWSVGDAIAFLAVMGLVVGAVSCLAVVIPRFGGRPAGIVFWKSIAQFPSAKDYTGAVIAEADALTEAKLKHCYELSKICTKKFRFLNAGIWGAVVGLVASVLRIAFY